MQSSAIWSLNFYIFLCVYNLTAGPNLKNQRCLVQAVNNVTYLPVWFTRMGPK